MASTRDGSRVPGYSDCNSRHSVLVRQVHKPGHDFPCVDAFLYRQRFPHRIGSLASIKAGLWYRSNSKDGQGSGSVSAEKELMFKRLKQALVESFVGAVALGYLLAKSIS